MDTTSDVHQSAAGSSSSAVPQLPHVFVYPPAEENNNFYCIFRGGPPSPTPFNSVFCQASTSSLRGKFGHDLYRQDPFQQTRVIRTRTSQWCLIYDAMNTSYDDDDNDVSGRSSSEAELENDDRCRPVKSQEYNEQTPQHKDNYIPERPASRRSSVFGNRSYDPLAEGSNDVHTVESPRSSLKSFRNRAVALLKRIGKPSTLGIERSGNVEYESWFDLGGRKTSRRRSQSSPHHLFNANPSQADVAVNSNTIPSSPRIIPTLSRKKSVLDRFRVSSRNDDSVVLSITHSSSEKPESFSQSLELVSCPAKKLSRRHSIARFFGNRGTTDRELGSNVVISNRSSSKDAERADDFTASRVPARIARPESPISLVSNASTARPLRRQSSFFRSSNTSVDELFCHGMDEDLPRRSSTAESLEASSERGSSSSVPRSSDSLTLEEELQSPVQTNIPTIVLHHCEDQEVGLLEDDGFLQKDIRMDVDDGPFGLDLHSGARHRTVVVDSPPMLDLAVHLNSLTFDTLAFDPDVFENPIDDDT